MFARGVFSHNGQNGNAYGLFDKTKTVENLERFHENCSRVAR
jgi:hypothetical protein